MWASAQSSSMLPLSNLRTAILPLDFHGTPQHAPFFFFFFFFFFTHMQILIYSPILHFKYAVHELCILWGVFLGGGGGGGGLQQVAVKMAVIVSVIEMVC